MREKLNEGEEAFNTFKGKVERLKTEEKGTIEVLGKLSRAEAKSLRDQSLKNWKSSSLKAHQYIQDADVEKLLPFAYDADKASVFPEKGNIEEVLLVIEAQMRGVLPKGKVYRPLLKNQEDIFIRTKKKTYAVSVKAFMNEAAAKQATEKERKAKGNKAREVKASTGEQVKDKLEKEIDKATGDTYVLFDVSGIKGVPSVQERKTLMERKNKLNPNKPLKMENLIWIDDL
jgi:hypothetical protein